MNGRLIRALCALLAAIICLTAFIGCTGCRNDTGEKKKNPLSVGETSDYGGVHTDASAPCDGFVAAGGETDYEIVIPDDYEKSAYLWTAASELSLFLSQSSGAAFVTVAESARNTDKKYISLGKTEASRAVPETDVRLGANGYRLVTVGENIFVLGEADLGVLNGVYGLLRKLVGFEVYAPDETTFAEGDVALMQLNVTEVPDIQYRVGDVDTRIDGDEAYRRRLGYNCTDDVFLYVKGTLYHNSVYYFDDVIDRSEYADWFNATRTQLCYTAHGNPERMREMQEYAANLIVEAARTSDANCVTFQQSDGDTWCDCDECTEQLGTYGTNAAVMVKFVNGLSDILQKKMTDAGMGERQITICIFAYMRTEKAPAVAVGDEWRPIDETVRCGDNIAVFYAPINADYTKPFNDTCNTAEYRNMLAWSGICKKLFVWLYQTNFSHYLYPYNSLLTMSDRYRAAAAAGAEFLFDQNQWDQKVKTGFHRLKAWMGAKLAWNTSLDYDRLLDEYFTGYFGAAAEPMRALYEQITYRMEQLSDGTMEGGIYYNVNQPKFYTKAILDGWLELIDRAYEAAELCKESDPQRYRRVVDRICLESLSVRYMRLELYSGKFGTGQLAEERISFRNDCLKLGVDMYAEAVSLSGIFETWGLQ